MQHIYQQTFIDLVNKFAPTLENPADYYIGIGNPNAKILIIGKEGATKEPEEYEICWASQWQKKIIDNETGNLSYHNPLENNGTYRPFRVGDTYTKYQKLHDYIFDESHTSHKKFEVDFFKNIFITEMNINRGRNSKETSKLGMQKRKEEFFKNSEFIQHFPVVILACGPYIENHNKKEIDTIFNVSFDKEYKSDESTNAQSFWLHYNVNKSKIVLHTRQLSANVKNTLLKKMADVIKEFLYEPVREQQMKIRNNGGDNGTK